MSVKIAPRILFACCYNILLLLVVTIQSYSLGLIAPIEVVEEWGCYDSEIRLTCGHLDSKIAILEAVFTPNCTHEDDCYRIDFKRISRAYINAKRNDPRIAETEAGRKFLETLRKTDLDEDDVPDYVDDQGDNSHRTADKEANMSSPNSKSDFFVSHKKKRTSLRASLERLIIKYLKKLSPNTNLKYELQKRSLRRKRESNVEASSTRIVLGARNITIDESELPDNSARNSEKRYRKLHSNRAFCPEQRRKVTTLNRFDIEKAMKNDSGKVHNIRTTLNQRCSGKNHCSFLFAMDYPYALLWNNGSVYLKYICMEEFRVNRYCGEHLIIGNEILQETPGYLRQKKGDPIAEARLQPREQGFHSLKIIKTSDQTEDISGGRKTSEREGRRRRLKLQQRKTDQLQSQGVYSQDFKVLKILPSNLDDIKDIEKVGNEIYFLKDESPSELVPTQNEVDLTTFATTVTTTVLPLMENPNIANISHKENITIIIREGEEYVLTFPKEKIPETVQINATDSVPDTDTLSTIGDFTTISTDGDETRSFSPSTLETDQTLNEIIDGENDVSTAAYEIVENEIETFTTSTRTKFVPVRNFSKIIESNKYTLSAATKPSIIDESGRRTYNSFQKTLFRDPLLQGFTMTPGYPKFYIGDMECKWVISAPSGQKIRLTLLDISLRYDPVCRDFMEIIDLDMGRKLFTSCNESIKPIGIISDSNRIQIMVKTTTKFAYPKRGVLLHYSALGCLTPNSPLNGRLVERTEYESLFECEAGYVFPDTSLGSRRLECKDNHEWDSFLPDCIEKIAVSGRDSISVPYLHIHKKVESSSKTEMTAKEADMVHDVIIPSTIIAALFVINAIIVFVIFSYRMRSRNMDTESKELAEL